MAGTMFAHGMRGSLVPILSLYTHLRHICLCLGLEDDMVNLEASAALFTGMQRLYSWLNVFVKYHIIQPSHTTALKNIL